MEEFENESREQQKLISSSHKTVNESPAEQNEQEERIDSSLEQLRKENDDLIKQALEYWDLYYRGKKSYVIAETARKGAVLKLQSAVWIRGFSIAGLFLGPLISGFGFFFWHTRIQKNQDLIPGPIDIHFNQMSEAAR